MDRSKLKDQFSSLAVRTALFFSGAIVVVGILLLALVFWTAQGRAEQQLASQLEKIAATAALQVDGRGHESFTTANACATETWQQNRQILENVRRVNGLEADHIYTFNLSPDRGVDQLFFAVMLHQQPFVGDPYHPPPQNKLLFEQVVRTGQARSTQIYEDRHGTWVSAFAPIWNGAEQVVGVLEVDHRVDTDNGAFLTARSSYFMPVLYFFLAALPFSFLLTFFLAKTVTRPIRELVQVTEYTAQGHWNHPLPLMKGSELKRLGLAFERMRQKIQTQLENLQRFNEKLEGQVASRTRDLQKINHQLTAVQAIVASVNQMISLEDVLNRAASALDAMIDLAGMALVLPLKSDEHGTVLEVLSRRIPEEEGFSHRNLESTHHPFNDNPDSMEQDKLKDLAQEILPGCPEAYLFLPLLVDEELIGILLLVHRGEKAFGVEHRQVFSLAVHIAAAIQKSHMIERFKTVNNELRDAQESLKKRTEAQIQYQKTHDPLTGLGNRVYFAEKLALQVARAQLEEENVIVLNLDMDRFSKVNESLGYEAGNTILCEVARLLKENLKHDDTLVRISANEFAIMLAGNQQTEDAARVSERLVQVLAQPIAIGQVPVSLTASIGIACYPSDGERVATLLEHAGVALTRIQAEGGNGYKYYDRSMNAESARRLALESELRVAIEQDQLVLYYQPQVAIHDGKLIGMEALVRWIHPERGLISPAEFIPLAEESGLIVPLDKWVTRAASEQIKQWLAAGLQAPQVGINLSARQFGQSDLIDFIRSVLCDTGIPPGLMELEITEGAAMVAIQDTIKVLRELKAMGISLAIDDFGTGYSSLSYLKQFDLDRLKIDKSFVDGLPRDSEDSAIVTAIVDLGHALGLSVIAEGVENEEQRAVLEAKGCDHVQGYFFSRPLPANEAGEILSPL